MSGLCGILAKQSQERLSTACVLPMVQALGTVRHAEACTAQAGPWAVGVHRQPYCSAGIVQQVVHGHTVMLAFTGNVYNIAELAPRAGADVETLPALLARYLATGLGFLQHIRGEFALALWDGRTNTLSVAIDRFRVHPMLYYQDAHQVVIASRLRSLLASPWPITRTIHPEALLDVSQGAVIPTPKTIFREVHKLPPGHVLTATRSTLRVAPYWEVDFLHQSNASEPALAETLRTAFADAIAVRVQADKTASRLGTFLSGGVDSSTVTGVLAQLAPPPIQSFSIGFDEQRFNEINYARIAATAFGTSHHEYFVTAQDAYQTIPTLMEWFDEPYGNASAIPTYFCAKLAREHGTEILYAGDGGDELFAGNERYAVQRLFDYYYKIPTWPREAIFRPLVFALAALAPVPLFVKGKKYIQRACVPYPERLTTYNFYNTMALSHLVSADVLAAVGPYDPDAVVAEHYRHARAHDELDRQLYIDLQMAISDNDLCKVTRMTEAAGVTVRFPFLDARLVDFALQVPAQIKMHGRQLRSFFKKAYTDLLPQAIRTKTKHGFGLPIAVWLRTDPALREMMHDLILSPQSVQRGYFRKQALEELVDHHTTDTTSFYGTILWHLMMLELWHRTYDRAPSTS